MSESTFTDLLAVPGPRTAWIKLDAICSGIAVDGRALEALPGYPQGFRTKRAHKRAVLCAGRVIDAVSGDVPWIPEELILHFEDGRASVVKVNHRPGSEVVLDFDGDALFLRREGCYRVRCSLNRRPPETGGLLGVLGADRVGVLGYEGCSGWLHRQQCRFCDTTPRRPDEPGPVPTLNDLQHRFGGDLEAFLSAARSDYFPRLARAWEAIGDWVTPHCHLHVMSGNLPDLDLTWRYHLDLARALAAVRPLESVDSYLNLMPPLDERLLIEAAGLGFRNVIFNMEVWGERDYAEVCPEKAALMPMATFLQRLRRAVDIYGPGNVRCGLVFGAQPLDRFEEGCRRLTELGVAVSTTVFTPKAGTPWAKRPAPAIRAVAEHARFLADLMIEHGHRPLYCRLSSRSEVLWELIEDDC